MERGDGGRDGRRRRADRARRRRSAGRGRGGRRRRRAGRGPAPRAGRGGLALDAVAAAARGALRAAGGGEAPDADDAPAGDALERRFTLTNRLGLHLRPAGNLVAAAAPADVDVANATTGAGPVSATSLIGLSELAKHGEEIVVRARGPKAAEVLDAIQALADDNWGDDDSEPEAAAAAPEPEAPAEADAPAPGEPLRGLPVAPGIAIGPAQRLRAPE